MGQGAGGGLLHPDVEFSVAGHLQKDTRIRDSFYRGGTHILVRVPFGDPHQKILILQLFRGRDAHLRQRIGKRDLAKDGGIADDFYSFDSHQPVFFVADDIRQDLRVADTLSRQ